jgi:hypothetical protein
MTTVRGCVFFGRMFAILQSSFLQANFVFTSPEVEVIEKIIVYDLDNFFSDFGGFLGLFLGASCFTLVSISPTFFEHLFCT